MRILSLQSKHFCKASLDCEACLLRKFNVFPMNGLRRLFGHHRAK